MSDGLSEQEIQYFASWFHEPTLVRQVLELAGVPRANQPVWQAGAATEYWREIGFLLSVGLLADGRESLFAAARHFTPAAPAAMPLDASMAAAPGPSGSASGASAMVAEARLPQVTVSNSIGVMITHGGTQVNDFHGVDLPAGIQNRTGASTADPPRTVSGDGEATVGQSRPRSPLNRWLPGRGRRPDPRRG